MSCTYNVAGPHEPDRDCGRAPVVAHVIAGQTIEAELCERHARSAAARIRATGARAPRVMEVPAHA